MSGFEVVVLGRTSADRLKSVHCKIEPDITGVLHSVKYIRYRIQDILIRENITESKNEQRTK